MSMAVEKQTLSRLRPVRAAEARAGLQDAAKEPAVIASVMSAYDR
jgi:hypothetical protein